MGIKVLFICPNPRQMSLISPTVALFYSILKENNIDMKFFDTTFYDVSENYINSDTYNKNILAVKDFNCGSGIVAEKTKGGLQECLSDFENECKNWNPDIIMASAMESTFLFTILMLKSAKKFNKTHVLGGVFATFAPEKAISYDEVDIICIGEGEKIIVPLCEKIYSGNDLSSIPNLWVKDKHGSILKTGLIAPVDLNDNPPFDASIFDDTRFYRAMAGKMYKMFPVETHRGCPNKCAFCNSPLQASKYKKETGGKYFRKKDIPNVIRDILYFANECKAEYLFFWADNFLAYTRKDIDFFCDAYAKIGLPFYVQSYPSTLDEYKIKRLLEVGLHRVGIGIEHGNEKFRKEVLNRNYSNQTAIEKISILKKYNIQFSCNNIVGFPLETPELHEDTVRLNRAIDPDSASCSIFTPFHGTPLRKLSISLGFLKDPDLIAPTNDDISVLDMPQFPKELISGKSRTFNLYLKFPENRWSDIQRAEKLTSEGNLIWESLKEEFAEKYQ